MIGVFSWLLRTTMRNRITRRIARLREPRYIVPTAVSVLWFGQWVIRPLFFGGRGFKIASVWDLMPPDAREALVFVGGLVIFVWIAVLWIIPDKKAALQFSPAELHFLFPAPITRRQLVQYKLMQAQIGILFGALVTSFFFGRLSRPGGWLTFLTIWLFFAIAHLHGIGASFVRTDLMESGWSAIRRRAISIVVVIAVVAAVYVSAHEAWMTAVSSIAEIFSKDGEEGKAFHALSTALAHAGRTGISGVLLWPFLALPRLLFAHTPGDFLLYGAFGLVLLVAHYFWVINTDTSFEEASLELSQKRAERTLERQRMRRTGGILVKKANSFPWKLSPKGRPEIALMWKNLVNVTRVTPVRALFALSAFVMAMLFAVLQRQQERDNLWFAAALLSAFIAGITTVMGPVFMRNDLREDLFRIDAIKTMPLAGHSIVWGEVLGSWTALVLIEGLMLIASAFCYRMSGGVPFEGVSSSWLYYGMGAAVLVFPALTLAATTIQNAMVVLFPAWVALGNSRARGFEASGQRILTLFGTMFVLSVVALPAAASGGAAAWLLSAPMGPACLLVGAVIAGAWMLGEVIFACRMLGGVVDRLDPSTAGIEAQED